MTRSEFAEMVRRLYLAGKITAAQSANMQHGVKIGSIAIGSMPLPWKDLPGRLTPEEFKDALFHAAVRLTPQAGKKLVSTGSRAKITNTPPEVEKFLRERLRNHLRGDYEGTMKQVAQGLAAGQDVRSWHKKMVLEQRAYIARQMTAGLGRALTEKDIEEVNRLGRLQNGYLQGFAAEVSARRILGNDFSQAYLVNRHLQYGGMGWGAWFRGNEIAEARGDGYVIIYDAQDDGRTCSPCREAAVNGPYLPGSDNVPYPGEVCRGHGLCRCKHIVRFDMEAWRRLKGLPEPDLAEKTGAMSEERKRTVALSVAQKEARKRRADEAKRKRKAEDEAIERARLEDEARIRKRRAEEEAAAAKASLPSRLSMFTALDQWRKDANVDTLRLRIDFETAGRSTRREPSAHLEEFRALVQAQLTENRLESKAILTHGLAESQQMEGALIDGVEVRWVAGMEKNAVATLMNVYINDLIGNKLPMELWRINHSLFFTDQDSKDDPYWADKYGKPDFKSAASGGDGAVMVYGGRALSVGTLAHESAHNLATEIYGGTNPAPDSILLPDGFRTSVETEWAWIIDEGESVVSEYASVAPDEDFAETFRSYVMDKAGLAEKHPMRFALVEKLLRGEGEREVRDLRPVHRGEVPAPRIGETDGEKKERRRLEHLRWKERKALEAEEAKRIAAGLGAPVPKGPDVSIKVPTDPAKDLATATATAKEDERLVAGASRAKYDTTRVAVEEAKKTLDAGAAEGEARDAEVKRLSKALTHLRWRAKRTSGDVLADVERRILEGEAELKKLKETPSETVLRKDEEDAELARLVRLGKEREEAERAEAARLAAEVTRLAEAALFARMEADRLEAERLAAEEATRIAAEIEAEKIRILEEKKEKKRLTHLAWKAKKAAEKSAALAVPKLSRPGPEIRADIDIIDAEVTRIRDKRSRGEVDTPEEKAFMDTRRTELGILWEEVKRSEDEDASLLAGPLPATGLPAKVHKPVLSLEREISRIEVEAIRISRRSLAGEIVPPDELDLVYGRRSKVEALEKERDASRLEDGRRASASGTVGPKKYRHVISLESEISTIEGEAGRLGRKSRRGETLTAAESDFLSKKDDRLVVLRKDLALSMAEDKTRLSTSGFASTPKTTTSTTAKAAIMPDKKLRPVMEISSDIDAWRGEVTRLSDILRSGTRLTPDDEKWYLSRMRVKQALDQELLDSRKEDADIAAAERKAAAKARGATAGPVNIKYRPDPKEKDALAGRTIDDLTRQGVDPDDALAAFKDILDRHPAIINTKSDILSYWKVGEERFKTQFETGTSMGANNNDLRARAEKPGLGYSADANVRRSERPVYGALRTDPNAGKSYGGRDGGFAWKVKDSVKERMTVTMGDSLGAFQSGSQMGTPMNDPGFEGIGSTWGQSDFIEYVKSKRTQADLDRFIGRIAYIEWQCQGQLLLSDIEWMEDRGRNLSADDVKWLEDRGVEVRR